MKIVVTGADGFIGRNLCLRLQEAGYNDLIKISRKNSIEELNMLLNKPILYIILPE